MVGNYRTRIDSAYWDGCRGRIALGRLDGLGQAHEQYPPLYGRMAVWSLEEAVPTLL